MIGSGEFHSMKVLLCYQTSFYKSREASVLNVIYWEQICASVEMSNGLPETAVE
jgi:hypothetical protein